MSKRYAVCKIVGDGQSADTAFRVALKDVVIPGEGIPAFNVVQFINLDPQTGQPVTPWGFCVARPIPGGNWNLARGNPDIDLLPEYPLDAAVEAMHLPTRQGMAVALVARNIATDFIGAADGFRDVVNHLGRTQEPAFEADDVEP